MSQKGFQAVPGHPEQKNNAPQLVEITNNYQLLQHCKTEENLNNIVRKVNADFNK